MDSSAVTETALTLSWQATTDNVGVSGYRVSRDGITIADADVLSYADSGLSANTTYNYSVVAYDAAGNESAAAVIGVTTDDAVVASPPPPVGSNPSGGNSGGGGGALAPLVFLLLTITFLATRKLQLRCACLIATLTVMALPPITNAHEDVHLQLQSVGVEIDKNPEDYRLFIRRGRLLGLNRHWTGAVAAYKTAQRTAPPEKAAFLNLNIGDALHAAGNTEEALLHVSKFLSDFPKSSYGWRNKGRVLASLGYSPAAVDCFDLAIRFSEPPTPELFFERAQALIDDLERTDDLLAGIDEGISILGPLVSLLELAVEVEEARGNFAGAVHRIDNMPAAIRDQARWLHRRSLALEQLRQHQQAIATNRLALQAIEQLPASRRSSAAYLALRQEIEATYSRLTANITELFSFLAD